MAKSTAAKRKSTPQERLESLLRELVGELKGVAMPDGFNTDIWKYLDDAFGWRKGKPRNDRLEILARHIDIALDGEPVPESAAAVLNGIRSVLEEISECQ